MRTIKLLTVDEVCIELGGRIKRLRLTKNLTQQQLADMTQSSLSSIRRLESKGQAGLELVVRVAQALQATEYLDSFFRQPVQTIAQAEREQSLAVRQRARLPNTLAKYRQ